MARSRGVGRASPKGSRELGSRGIEIFPAVSEKGAISNKNIIKPPLYQSEKRAVFKYPNFNPKCNTKKKRLSHIKELLHLWGESSK